MGKTRDQIVEFSRAFKRPVNTSPAALSVSDRILLGKLMLEETVEYVTKGLGLSVHLRGMEGREVNAATLAASERWLDLEHHEGQMLDIVQCAAGLGDINVVAHFNALWHGFNLDDVTTEIHMSNMSKLNDAGEPIINHCVGTHVMQGQALACNDSTHLVDPSKPVGKILKSANFFEPNLVPVINAGNSDLAE